MSTYTQFFAAGGSAATISATAPAVPATGDIWFNSTSSTAYLWDGAAWVDITATGGGIKSNYTATVLPAVTNDSSQGYATGSLWINTVSQLSYHCMNPTIGAAVWKLIS